MNQGVAFQAEIAIVSILKVRGCTIATGGLQALPFLQEDGYLVPASEGKEGIPF